jgi:hypothetical protein
LFHEGGSTMVRISVVSFLPIRSAPLLADQHPIHDDGTTRRDGSIANMLSGKSVLR